MSTEDVDDALNDIENPKYDTVDEEKFISHGEKMDDEEWKKCLILYERNIYESLACKEGSPFVGVMIFISQLMIPLFIIISESAEIKEFMNGNVRVSLSVSLAGTLLQGLLWSMIVSDTRRSIDAFDVTGGFTKLPRPYMIHFGMWSTVVVNLMSGIAGFALIIKSETVEDSALNALAMFFINRLDEDLSKSRTSPEIIKKMCKDTDMSGVADLLEDDEETAIRRRKKYGPWVYNQHLDGCWFTTLFAIIMEMVGWLLAVVVPIVYFILSMPI